MFVGLGIFVFISGLLIDLNYSRRIKNLSDILSFYKKRAVRILPLSWVAVVLFVSFAFVFVPIYLPSFSAIYPKANVNFLWLLSQITGSQEFIQNFASLYWFVGFIIICYLIYPILAKFSTKTYHLLLLSLIPLLIFGALRTAFNLMDDRLFLYYMVFFSAIIINRLGYVWHSASYKRIALSFIMTLIFLLIFFWRGTQYLLNTHLADFVVRQMTVFDLAIVSGCVSLLMLLNRARIYNILEKAKSVITFVAFSSYCTYLFHLQFFTAGEGAIQIFELPTILGDSLFYLIVVPFTFVCCYYIQKSQVYFTKKFSSTEDKKSQNLDIRSKIATKSKLKFALL